MSLCTIKTVILAVVIGVDTICAINFLQVTIVLQTVDTLN